MQRGTNQVEFHYGADRSRTLKRELEGGIVTSRTHYVGNVEVVWEGSNPASGTGEYRRYIGGVAIATWFEASNIDRVRYQHTNHQGSITALTDENGQIEAQMGFDAWGQRRNGNDWNAVWQQWVMGITPAWAMNAVAVTPRGYTGHEHVDDMGIIHMNGRIYDALLARFLQADPFVEDATTLNRYTYVHNNPLAFTDPSGYFSFGLKDAFKLAAVVAISVYTGGLAAGKYTLLGQTLTGGKAFAAAVIGGAAAGAISAGSVEGALWGAFSGAVFFGIGQGFEGLRDATGGVFNTGLNSWEFAAQSVSHGIAGGTISVMQGGRFGHGFLSAGVSKAATPGALELSDDIFVQGFAVAIVGGTTSEISGGKFANGATTAAMAFAFNQVASRFALSQRAKTEEEAIQKGIASSRGVRAKADDFTRNDRDDMSFARLRGQRIGGVVVQTGESEFFAPRGFDFLLGSSGFNFRHGDGLRMTGFMSGTIDEGNVRALIVNIPDGRDLSPGFGADASFRFDGAPVFLVQGTSNNVLRVQIDLQTNKFTCSIHSGDVSC